MILPTLLCAVLTQTPAVLVVSRHTGIDDAQAAALVEETSRRLAKEGVTLSEPPERTAARLQAMGVGQASDCAGAKTCLAKLGRAVGASMILTLEAGQVEDELALHLEALLSETAAREAQATFVVRSQANDDDWEKPIRAFAVEVKAALVRLPPPKKDVPAQVTLEPSPSKPPVEATPVKTTNVLRPVLISGAALSVAASVAFFAVAQHQRAALYGPRLAGGGYAPAFPRSESEARARVYDRNYALSASALVVAAGLGIGAAISW